MATFFLRLPRLRFSLGALLVMLTATAAGFGLWWRMPWQIDHLPKELSEHRAGESPFGLYGCGTTGEDLTAVWTEELPYELFSGDTANYYQREEKPVHAKSGKCWVRRDWHKPWVLDGATEVFNADGQRIIIAHYRSGKLHGEFCSWFTDGKVRETGKYWHGQMDGVWEERQFRTGKVIAHAEYKRGQKCGVWNLAGVQEVYEGGKIVRQSWPAKNAERVGEFDEQERLKQETYWWKEPRERYGIDRYLAEAPWGRTRHGDWERICPFDGDLPAEVKFTQRGSWTDGLPTGEWVYERPGVKPRRLQFRAGVLQTIDGAAANDLLMQKYAARGDSELAAILRLPDHQDFAGQERQAALYDVLGYAPILHMDRRLGWSEEQLQRYFAERLPDDFRYSNLPGSACLCLLLHEAGLTIDLRHHALWLTTPQLAAEWRDETNTAPWFEKIVNARPTRYDPPQLEPSLFEPGKMLTLEDDGMDPDMMRNIHFDDWKEAWENRQVIEFRKPLECERGIARRIDPNFDRSRKLPELLERGIENFQRLKLDEMIAYECELHGRRLKLRGETLVFEAREGN